MSLLPSELSNPSPVRPKSSILGRSSSAAMDSNANKGDGTPSPGVSTLKLLNSHLSIYHALNNPQLDVTSTPSSPVQKCNQLVNRHLTNLNHPQHLLDKERFPTPSNDSSFSLASWQAISMSSESIQDIMKQHSKKPTNQHSPLLSNRGASSIISFTSDEDEVVSNSLVRVTSVKKDKVMVFETDEEDEYAFNDVVRTNSNDSYNSDFHDDDEKTLSINMNHLGGSTKSENSFIMPKMAISDRLKKFQITILTSNNLQYQGETNQLIKELVQNSNFSNSDFHITHLMLDNEPRLKYNELVVKTSDLIFIINDGSDCFVDELTNIFRSIIVEKRGSQADNIVSDEELLPKITVINMMTVNYFSNLFEIINCLRPCQVWKTSSLKNPTILNKLKQFIREELSDGDHFKQDYFKKLIKVNSKKEKSSSSNSMYLNLVPTEKTNYKLIEKQIKSELKLSNIDPLRISSSLPSVNVFYVLGKHLFRPQDSKDVLEYAENLCLGGPGVSFGNGNNLWLLCSFTLGIGLGVTIASGAVTMAGFYLCERVPTWFFHDQAEETAELNNFLPVQYTDSENSVLKKLMSNVDSKLDTFNQLIMDKVVDTSNSIINSVLNTVYDIVSAEKVSNFFGLFVDQFKSINSVVIDSVKGGTEKLITIAFPSIL